MNLLVRKRIGWLLTISILLMGCRDEDGLQITPDVQNTKIEFIEFNLPTTNLFIDSLRTDEGSTMIVGEYSDDVVGIVKATGYADFFYRDGPLPTFLENSDRNIDFDSLSFESINVMFKISDFVNSVDGLVQSLEFYELEDTIFSNVLYLADRELAIGRQLGADSKTFNPKGLAQVDLSSDSVLANFELADFFGLELFERIANLDPEDTDSISSLVATARIRFPGIAFTSNGSTGIMSYDLSSSFSNIELHLSSPDSSYVIRFQFTGPQINNFNHITRDRNGSIFATLEDRRVLDVSNDFVYFNPIASIMPRIDLSPFLDFVRQNESDDIIVQRAQLLIGAQRDNEFVPEVPTSKFYFSRPDSSDLSDIAFNINWSGIGLNPIGTLLQTDETYLNGQNPIDLTADFDSEKGVYSTFPNAFFQDILDQTQSGFNIYSDNLVMASPVNTLSKSIINKDSVKLQIFYVRLN